MIEGRKKITLKNCLPLIFLKKKYDKTKEINTKTTSFNPSNAEFTIALLKVVSNGLVSFSQKST